MIRRQLDIPASPHRVWESLTDPELLKGWFGGEIDWQLTEGAPLVYRGEGGAVREGRIESVRIERHLKFSWWPQDRPEYVSEVSYLIEPADDGTRLTVQERQVDAPPVPAGGPPPAQACASPGTPAAQWTAWDSRLAGAWVEVCSGTVAGGPAQTNVRARA